MSSNNLMKDGRFWPTFWTQFLGAFNDNVYKNGLVILITFQAYSLAGIPAEQMVALCGGIFILPFFLFSAVAGQICDKYPKDKLMVLIKIWEILVMCLGAFGFISESIILLLVTLFFMGLQSTFFGPIKYAILPELIGSRELVQGNSLVSMGTFVAILMGTILGGSLMGIEENGKYLIATAVIIFSIIGTLFSRRVKPLTAANPELKISYGISSSWKILKITMKDKSIFQAILGISWFWFLGAALLSMFPVYVKDILNGNENVATLFLAMFSIGVAIGSIGCEKLSRERLELGLVPFGSFGISLFVFDLFLIGDPALDTNNLQVMNFLTYAVHWRILFDLLMLSIFSGFFIVPLYTYIQEKSNDGERSQVIAGLNILNSLFMVVSAISLTVLYQFNFTLSQIYGIWAVLNLMVCAYIYTVIPEFILRFIAVIITRMMYRLKVNGHSNIPYEGACILVCNHVSFVDWLVIGSAIKRPLRFVMYYKFMRIPIMKYIFKSGRVIPIAGRSEDAEILTKAMLDIEAALRAGDAVCIFPEGSITRDGEVSEYKKGIEKMLENIQVPVIPITLNNLWGSFFSRKYNNKALGKPSLILTHWFRKISVNIYPAWDPKDVSAKKLEDYTKDKIKNP